MKHKLLPLGSLAVRLMILAGIGAVCYQTLCRRFKKQAEDYSEPVIIYLENVAEIVDEEYCPREMALKMSGRIDEHDESTCFCCRSIKEDNVYE